MLPFAEEPEVQLSSCQLFDRLYALLSQFSKAHRQVEVSDRVVEIHHDSNSDKEEVSCKGSNQRQLIVHLLRSSDVPEALLSYSKVKAMK